jgi:hypothetical protein
LCCVQSSNADYEETLKARWDAENREEEAEAMLANGTLFGGNLTQGQTGPAYRPKASAGMTAADS